MYWMRVVSIWSSNSLQDRGLTEWDERWEFVSNLEQDVVFVSGFLTGSLRENSTDILLPFYLCLFFQLVRNRCTVRLYNPSLLAPVIRRGHVDVIVYVRFIRLLSFTFLQSVKINFHWSGLHITNCKWKNKGKDWFEILTLIRILAIIHRVFVAQI